MNLERVEMGSRFYIDMLEDFKGRVEKNWEGEREILKKLFQPGSMKLVETIKSDEAKSFVIFKENSPIGIVSYRTDNSNNVDLIFFHLHRKFQGQNLEYKALDQLIKTLRTDPKIQEIRINLDRSCRFIEDSKILYNLGFRFQEWEWMKLDIEDFVLLSQGITGYDLIPWDNQYLSDIVNLNIEAKVLIQDQGICKSENFDQVSSIICVRDEEVCGFSLVQRFYNFAVIEYLFVSEHHRHMGIGRFLVLTSLSRLKDERIKHVVLEVGSDNVSAISLFQRMGFSFIAKGNLIGRLEEL